MKIIDLDIYDFYLFIVTEYKFFIEFYIPEVKRIELIKYIIQ